MHRIRAIFRRPTNCTGIEKPEILKLQVSPIQERVSFCAGYSFFIPTDNDYTKETIALTKIIKTINAIHDMTSPATAKLRGVLKIPTNEKIKPKAYNTQPSPGTQLKIKPTKARIKPAVPSPFVLLRSC